MIAGLESATAGDILIAGQRVNDLPAREAQHRHGVPVLRALPAPDGGGEPRLSAACRGLGRGRDRRARRARSRDVLAPRARCSTAGPTSSAEGEKQRVAVGRSIVRDPTCFLFDEPLSAPRRPAAPDDARRRSRRCWTGLYKADGHRHPRPARGADHGRPHRGHARRPDRAGGHAARHLRQARPTSSSPASSARRR